MSDRGIRLGDLDPDRQYVIGKVRTPKGRRWEVLGEAPSRAQRPQQTLTTPSSSESSER